MAKLNCGWSGFLDALRACRAAMRRLHDTTSFSNPQVRAINRWETLLLYYCGLHVCIFVSLATDPNAWKNSSLNLADLNAWNVYRTTGLLHACHSTASLHMFPFHIHPAIGCSWKMVDRVHLAGPLALLLPFVHAVLNTSLRNGKVVEFLKKCMVCVLFVRSFVNKLVDWKDLAGTCTIPNLVLKSYMSPTQLLQHL